MNLVNHIDFLQQAVIPLRLANRTQSGWPINLSLWYLHEGKALYCATSSSAKIVRYIENDPRCAFEIASDLPPYCGIRGQARAILQPDRGGEILEKLLHRYLGGTNSLLAVGLLKNRAKEVAIRLEPVNVFSWNFSARMRDSLNYLPEKPCP